MQFLFKIMTIDHFKTSHSGPLSFSYSSRKTHEIQGPAFALLTDKTAMKTHAHARALTLRLNNLFADTSGNKVKQKTA